MRPSFVAASVGGLLNIEREAEVFLDIIDSGGSVGGPVRRGRAPARYIGKPVQLRGLACGCSAVIRRGEAASPPVDSEPPVDAVPPLSSRKQGSPSSGLPARSRSADVQPVVFSLLYPSFYKLFRSAGTVQRAPFRNCFYFSLHSFTITWKFPFILCQIPMYFV